jgi:hypothetical protein
MEATEGFHLRHVRESDRSKTRPASRSLWIDSHRMYIENALADIRARAPYEPAMVKTIHPVRDID